MSLHNCDLNIPAFLLKLGENQFFIQINYFKKNTHKISRSEYKSSNYSLALQPNEALTYRSTSLFMPTCKVGERLTIIQSVQRLRVVSTSIHQTFLVVLNHNFYKRIATKFLTNFWPKSASRSCFQINLVFIPPLMQDTMFHNYLAQLSILLF